MSVFKWTGTAAVAEFVEVGENDEMDLADLRTKSWFQVVRMFLNSPKNCL